MIFEITHPLAQAGVKVTDDRSAEDFPTIEISEVDSKEHNKCSACGEEYDHPLLAENLSSQPPKEYYACSRCLSKVAETEKKTVEIEEEGPIEEEEKPAKFSLGEIPKIEIKASCHHELGYLKKRERGSPIPDECLICAKMIDCM